MFSFQGAFLSFFFKRLNEASDVLSFIRNFSQSLILVELSGIEPLTSCLQGRRSPSWAKPPDLHLLFFKSGGPKWTRFSAEKPRRLQQSTGLLLRAAFRVHFGSLGLTLFSPLGLRHFFQFLQKWWAKMDSNHRPHDYQSCALASWAIGPYQLTSFGGD